MISVLLVFHVFLCVLLVGAVLLQAGKGADIGAVFGGSSQTVFGSRGPATFLAKLTVGIAVVFLITSLSLARMARNISAQSVIDKANLEKSAPAETKTPAKTEAPAAEKK